jgi:hypothetical protein
MARPHYYATDASEVLEGVGEARLLMRVTQAGETHYGIAHRWGREPYRRFPTEQEARRFLARLLAAEDAAELDHAARANGD